MHRGSRAAHNPARDLIFDDLPIVEYATFMEGMRDANIHVFLQ